MLKARTSGENRCAGVLGRFDELGGMSVPLGPCPPASRFETFFMKSVFLATASEAALVEVLATGAGFLTAAALAAALALSLEELLRKRAHNGERLYKSTHMLLVGAQRWLDTTPARCRRQQTEIARLKTARTRRGLHLVVKR